MTALPGSFREAIAEDAAQAFCDPNVFGESIVYYPGGDLTKPKVVRAVVLRAELAPIAGDELIEAVTIRLQVPNHALHGITAHTASDVAEVACRIGDPVKKVQVERVITADAAMWLLEARL